MSSVTELELRHRHHRSAAVAGAPAALLYWRVASTNDTPFKTLVADIEATGAEIRPQLATCRHSPRFADDLSLRSRPECGAAPRCRQRNSWRVIELSTTRFVRESPETKRLHRLAWASRAGSRL